jgi:hypothetical protein
MLLSVFLILICLSPTAGFGSWARLRFDTVCRQFYSRTSRSQAPYASYLRNGKDASPPRLPLLQLLLLSLLHAAGVFLDRIASFES